LKDLNNVLRALRALSGHVRDLAVKVDALVQAHKGPKIKLDERRLLDLPAHLQKTMLTIVDAGKPCSAMMIAEKTGRARAMESKYLNELAWQGLLLRSKKGRVLLFEPAGLQEA
jgi:hypothetical protein